MPGVAACSAITRAGLTADADVNLLGNSPWHAVPSAPGDVSIQTLPPGESELQVPDVTAAPVRVEVARASGNLASVRVTRSLPVAVPSGHRVKVEFYSRCATQDAVLVVLQQTQPKQATVISLHATLTPRWEHFEQLQTIDPEGATSQLAGATTSPAVAHLVLEMRMGLKPAAVDVAGLKICDLGEDPALIMTRQALKPEAIQARIEKYRKGDLQVEVRDTNGRPLNGVAVSIVQQRHAFLFGANLFRLQPQDTSPTQLAYQQHFSELCNYATLPFYWNTFEPAAGKTEDPRLRAMIRWCNDRHIITKGHPLLYHLAYPSWASPSADEAIAQLHARVTCLVSQFSPDVRFWDVVNEANTAAFFTPASHRIEGEVEWIRRDGPVSVVETALKWAREADPLHREKFLYNDFEMGDEKMLLDQLAADHALPDVIGIQSHMHGGNWSMATVWRTAEMFAEFGLPIHFTETTVLSSNDHRSSEPDPLHPKPWPSTPAGEAAQADYLVQFYQLLFSHPSVTAITYWDLTDFGAWKDAPAGLLRKDMSPKPAFNRLMRLIHHAWWTNTSGTTDGQGRFSTRAFYGDYFITATDAAGHVVRSEIAFPAGETKTVVLTLAK